MKIVDKDYSYDELEGFEVFRPQQPGMRQEIPQMTIRGRQLHFTKETLSMLGDPEYIKIRINAERKILLIEKSDYKDENALHMRTRAKNNKVKNQTECTNLMRTIEKLTNKDLSIVCLVIEGTSSRKVRNAVMFDLNTAAVKKRRSYTFGKNDKHGGADGS